MWILVDEGWAIHRLPCPFGNIRYVFFRKNNLGKGTSILRGTDLCFIHPHIFASSIYISFIFIKEQLRFETVHPHFRPIPLYSPKRIPRRLVLISNCHSWSVVFLESLVSPYPDGGAFLKGSQLDLLPLKPQRPASAHTHTHTHILGPQKETGREREIHTHTHSVSQSVHRGSFFSLLVFTLQKLIFKFHSLFPLCSMDKLDRIGSSIDSWESGITSSSRHQLTAKCRKDPLKGLKPRFLSGIVSWCHSSHWCWGGNGNSRRTWYM